MQGCVIFYFISIFIHLFTSHNYSIIVGKICMDESFQDCSWIQDFEADFPYKESQPQNP